MGLPWFPLVPPGSRDNLALDPAPRPRGHPLPLGQPGKPRRQACGPLAAQRWPLQDPPTSACATLSTRPACWVRSAAPPITTRTRGCPRPAPPGAATRSPGWPRNFSSANAAAPLPTCLPRRRQSSMGAVPPSSMGALPPRRPNLHLLRLELQRQQALDPGLVAAIAQTQVSPWFSHAGSPGAKPLPAAGILEAAGITATLSGGGAVSICSHNQYMGHDLDFVTSADPKSLLNGIAHLGFVRGSKSGSMNIHARSGWLNSLPAPSALEISIVQIPDQLRACRLCMDPCA